MSTQTFHLPDVGEGLTEAEIVQWRVAPGDDPRAGRWAGFAKTECGLHP